MITFIEILSAFCLLLLIWAFFFMKSPDNIERKRVLKLTLLFVAYAQFVLTIHAFPFYNHLLFFTYTDSIFFYLVMPLLYMYFMSIIYNRPFFAPINAINMLPAIPGFIYVVYFNTLSLAEREGTLCVKNCGVLQDNWLYEIGLLSQVFYLILIIVRIHLFLKKQSQNLTPESIKRLQSYTWIMYLLIIVGVSVAILIIILPNVKIIHKVDLFMLTFIFSSVFYLLYFQSSGDLTYIKSIKSNSKKAYKNIEDTALQVVGFIEKNQSFKKTTISIASFSKEIKIPAYKISAAIKENQNMSFPEYINVQRIEFAKNRFIQDKDAFMKMDFIALECGFGSRSSFYAEFKKQIGVTPAEFVKSLKSDKL